MCLHNTLKKLAVMIRFSAMLPDQVIQVLDILDDLLSDDSNFIEPEKWGSIEDGRRVVPFSFSEKGLSELKRLRSTYPDFEQVYLKGTAGITQEKYSLVYFLVQFLVVLPMRVELFRYKQPKDENERRILESIRKKYERLDHKAENIRKLQFVPVKPTSRKEYERSRNFIRGYIRYIKNIYGQLNLTAEEKEYIRQL